MTVILSVLFLIVGVFCLSKGSDWLVDGASALAKKHGISPLVIGLTIVAFGTSAPELVVSTLAAYNGQSDISIANVLGSNIVNILFILGVCATIKPLSVAKSTVWKEIPLMLAAAVMVPLLAFSQSFSQKNLSNSFENFDQITGYLSIPQGLVLLIMFGVYMYYNFGIAKNTERNEGEEHIDENAPTWKNILIGLVGLTLGAKLTLDGAVDIATTIGISERIIGLTIVAIGTSLPELVTSVKATQRGENNIAIGNIVGSNIFNVFLILGVSSLIGTLTMGSVGLIDATVAILASLVVFFSLFIFKKHQIGRVEGWFMILCYVVYVSWLIFNG
jgi:cation:H+ antiporter